MTAANYPGCIAFTLKYEGGYSVLKSDPGNWTGGKVGSGTLKGTMKGIAASSHPTLDIKNLSDAQIAAIYRKEYWDAVGGDAIPAGPDLATFDYGVNSGPSRGKAAYTAARAASSDPATIAKAICARRMSFLRGLGTFKTFGKGWTTRVAACEALAVKMTLAGGVKPVAQSLAIEADKAKNAAAKQTSGAVGSGAMGGAATVADQVGGNPSGIAIWIALAALVAGAILLILKSNQNAARALAYEDAAREEQP